MKKFLKIILSAITVIALAVMPMSVMAEEGVTYIISSMKLTEGINTYTVESNVPYTIYILNPTATGDFTITSDDCVMGIASYLNLWVQFEPTEEIVNLSEIEWSCTDINQAIMLAVKAEKSEISIAVSRTDPDTSKEIPWIIYENTFSPPKFEMPSSVDVDAFEDGFVDFEDDVIDDAVLGDDSLYHLNNKNGPVLFANLDDSIMSLYAMSKNGKLSAVYYDGNGDLFKKVDYTDAFLEYTSALPVDTLGEITSFYYPLTADLIEMFKELGATNNWYGGGSETWIYNSDDAWLYACYFDENVTSLCVFSHTAGEATKENEKAATCTETGSYDSVINCTVCGEEISREKNTIDIVDHIEGKAVKENIKAATCKNEGSCESVVYCTECGEELSRKSEVLEIDPDAHTYDNYEDTDCNDCGFVRAPFEYGDINGDRVVNNKDLGILMQYLNDWEVTIVRVASDVNVDDKVNNKDYGLLMQYLNDWDVTLGPTE